MNAPIVKMEIAPVKAQPLLILCKYSYYERKLNRKGFNLRFYFCSGYLEEK